jgi:hypothetical protein
MGIGVPVPLLAMLGVFGILGLGALVVLYGTIARNRWGINLEPVSCPRCGAPAPQARRPETLHQAMWGGWTCGVCGAEVDKWGRERATGTSRRIVRAEPVTRAALKKRFIGITAVAYFCLTLVFDWVGLKQGTAFPSTWQETLFQVGAALVETAAFTTLFFFAVRRLGNRLRLTGGTRDGAQGRGSGRQRQD